MIRVMHLIVGLNTGGAEANLSRLVGGMNRSRFENIVVSLLKPGPVSVSIEQAGVPVVSLRINRGIPGPLGLLRLIRLMHSWNPDLVQTWMYHADLLGGIAAKLNNGPPVIWNIRNGDSALSPSFMTRRVANLCAHLSSFLPARIVSCSNSGRDIHTAMGYSASRMEVIFNGYDLNHYRPDATAGIRLRDALGIAADAKLVTIIGRYHPLKDHAGFLNAARIIRDATKDAFFVMCGDQLSWDNAELGDRIRDLALTDCIFLLGRRKDVNDIMAASSVVVSSSRSEGFPNVIAEAMACGVTCVATDVGDSRLIIGSAGIVVPPRQPQALAEAVLTVLFQPPASADSIPAGRARIMENFELSSMIEKYERLYERVLSSDPQSNARWNGEHMTDSQTN